MPRYAVVTAFFVLSALFGHRSTLAQIPALQAAKTDPLEAGVKEGFGGAVALEGDVALVGAGGGLVEPGTVYLYGRDGGAWTAGEPLRPTPATRGDGFGQAVALDGGTAVVGAPSVADQTGAAFVFEQQADGTWMQTARLVPSDPAAGRTFGQAVDVRGGVALVGAPQVGTGVAYVFERDADGHWQQTGRLVSDDGGAGDDFGWSVALGDGEAFVGAQFAGQTGAVYVFRRMSAGTWTEQQRLTALQSAGGDRFGYALATDGDDLVIGAPVVAGLQGATYVFERGADGMWNEAATLTRDVTSADRFGNAVALQGDRLWSAAFRRNRAGAVYTYRRNGTRWEFEQELGATTASPNALFGYALALDGEVGLVGAFGDEMTYPVGLEADAWKVGEALVPEGGRAMPVTGARVACAAGVAAGFPCSGVDLLAFVPTDRLGSAEDANDLWGWVDPETGREYALAGLDDGTSFVDVTDPVNPVVLGFLPRPAGVGVRTWRDVKAYADHAFIVADGVGAHGMQVFDLRQLREVTDPPVTFEATARYTGFGSAHNIVINEATGFAYAVGINGEVQADPSCGAGLHMIDVRNPADPQFAGCFTDLETGGLVAPGYIHDAQCVVYGGPDADYQGREVCVSASERWLGLADVTDKDNPVAISRATYPTAAYVHQGWLTEDHRYFFQDDELDETGGLVARTRTLIWDLADLDAPLLVGEHLGATGSSDHNQYVRGDFLFQANYASGLRVLDISTPTNPVEVAFFDTVPSTDAAGFSGAWSVYPFLPSGNLLVSSSEAGLFVVVPTNPVISDTENDAPISDFALGAAYPNPLREATTLAVTLPAPGPVTVAAYDVLGRQVTVLHHGPLPAGTHHLRFDAADQPAGTYFVRAMTPQAQTVQTVVIVR